MKKKSSLHFAIALAMFILFLARVLDLDSGRNITAPIITGVILVLGVAHLVVGLRKRTD